jgi:hypothetical protein
MVASENMAVMKHGCRERTNFKSSNKQCRLNWITDCYIIIQSRKSLEGHGGGKIVEHRFAGNANAHFHSGKFSAGRKFCKM